MRTRKAGAVLAGARALFLQQGFGATSVDEVAGRAGVSKATVYSNFADKEALRAALVAASAAEAEGIIAEAVGALRGHGPVEERLVRVGLAILQGVVRQ